MPSILPAGFVFCQGSGEGLIQVYVYGRCQLTQTVKHIAQFVGYGWIVNRVVLAVVGCFEQLFGNLAKFTE
jgi:hypothetical protein